MDALLRDALFLRLHAIFVSSLRVREWSGEVAFAISF
jgi:hypothetical protein